MPVAGLRVMPLEKATVVSAAAVSSAAGTEGDRLRRVREPSGLETKHPKMASASISLSFSSSLIPSPLLQDRNKSTSAIKHRDYNASVCGVIRCAFASPARRKSTSSSSSSSSPAVGKKKLWKQGEFPGTSEAFIEGRSRKTPIKNIKKKLDRKNNVKAWANTAAEAMSDLVLKKQWLQALEVFSLLFSFPFSFIIIILNCLFTGTLNNLSLIGVLSQFSLMVPSGFTSLEFVAPSTPSVFAIPVYL